MLISNKHKFIFIHVYKTGGSSITHALLPYCKSPVRVLAHNILSQFNIQILKPFPYDGHITAQNLANKIGKNSFSKYFSFSFVRNPWDWHVSLYHFMLSRQDHRSHKEIKQIGSFENYIKWRRGGMKSQKSFITDENGEKLVNFVGRFEALHADYQKVCETIGVKAKKLPHRKRILKKPYQYYYTPKLRDMVATINKEDIDFFEYEFDG